jgi:hypothetical protein
MAALVTVPVSTGPASAQVIGPDEPPPPAGCAIERLAEQAGWSMSIVTGADRTGRYIVGRGYPSDPGGDFRRFVVVWFNGVPTPVEVPGADQQLADVNAFGVAVGFSFDAATFAPMTPWRYRGGEVTALPGVASGEAWAVNDRGDVAGTSRSGGTVPVWWPATGGGPVELALPAGALGGEARDIDEDGTVAGFYADADFVDHGIAWRPDGSIVELTPPAGLGPETRAFGIRNGWVFGLTTGGPSGFLPLRWHLPTGEVREFPQLDIAPQSVNRFGWLVGGDVAGRALFVADESDLSLPGLTDPPSGLGDLAIAVSDSARIIAGQASDPAGALRAVRWSCSV